MGAEEYGVDTQRSDDLVRDRADKRVRSGDHAAGDDHLHILGFEGLDQLGHGNRIGEDGDAAGLLRFEQMLGEDIGRGAAADGDYIAGSHIFDGFLGDGVLQADIHLRLDGEQGFAEQGTGSHRAAMDALQQSLVGKFGDIAADGHRRHTQFLR